MEERLPREHNDVVLYTHSYVPAREWDGHPYRLDTCGGRRPRRRYYETLQELHEAVVKANPGKQCRMDV
jgi:hypothetical protein